MTTVFVICAAFGGTILILQAVMTVVGFGGDALHTDVAHDFGHDFGGDAHADAGGLDSDTGADVHADASAGSSEAHHGGSYGHGSSRLFAMLSFRGIVAAMAFFGLGGWTAQQSAELPIQTVLLIAVASGGAAMYGMYLLMEWLASLHAEGTVRMDGALGQPAIVYLRIPGARSGAGKIQIDLQNRTMEYLAETAGEPLPTGARVVVVGIVNPETVEVRPLSHSEGDVNE